MGNPKKFLTAYSAITGVGAAALGYMALSSASARSDAETDYQQKFAKVETLQKSKVYPNQAGVDAKAGQVKAMAESVDKLAAAIRAFQLPDDPTATSATVQTKLTKYINDVTAAAGSELKLPEGFDLGFDPLGLKPANAKDFESMQSKELSNGRLAMLAAAGFCVQEQINGKAILENLGLF